jgi:hypothetical protein
MLLIICSVGFCAVLSRQNAINRCHIGVSPLRSAYQTSVAQSAPPEVPLMLTEVELVLQMGFA